MSPASPCHDADFRSFVDRYRARCLWFLRDDYYPSTLSEGLEVLRQIERHGDRDAFRHAAQFRTWLSQHTNETSAAS